MRKKNIHLVFGRTSNNILLQSGFIDPEKEEVMMLTDPLSLGPLSGVNDERGITPNR